MSILIFEDAAVNQLAPITTARPACSITVGSFNLVELLGHCETPLVCSVRAYLRPTMELDVAEVLQFDPMSSGESEVSSKLPGTGPALLLNARALPSIATLRLVQDVLTSADSKQGIIWYQNQVAAICNPGWSWDDIAQKANAGFESLLLAANDLPKLDLELPVLSYPHEVIAANMEVIGESLEFRIAGETLQQRTDGVFVGENSQIGEHVVTDTAGGPIIIDRGASVGAYTLLRGPIYIGPNARILEHAAIKDEVSLGHTTKIGGEVEAAIVEPYSNKQHHGFLGHSYLGSWINLGAGTCNSDLKNTYGTVNMEYPNGKAATGMQFLGCVMGDYSKTAINTGIFTGKVIGVCSMMYGFVTSNVPSFVNYARLFGQIASLPPEVMIATQQRMFARRKVEQRPCDMQLLYDMYAQTQHERDRTGEVLGF